MDPQDEKWLNLWALDELDEDENDAKVPARYRQMDQTTFQRIDSSEWW